LPKLTYKIKYSDQKNLLIAKPNFFCEEIFVDAVLKKLNKKSTVLFKTAVPYKLKHFLLKRKEIKSQISLKQPTQISALLLLGFSVLLCGWKVLEAALASAGPQKYFQIFKKAKVFEIQIGDCVCNSYLRHFHYQLRMDFKFLKTLFSHISQVALWNHYLSLVPNASPKYFVLFEFTYLDETLRRFFLKKNLLELRQNINTGKLEILRGMPDGKELCMQTFYSGKKSRKTAQRELLHLSQRKKRFLEMDKTADVNLQASPPLGGMPKAAFLFMHAVSDAQFLFGSSCFVDLNEWFWFSVKAVQNLKLPLVIKAHPMYFDKWYNYSVDKSYLRHLETSFQINFSKIKPHDLMKTSHANVYFIHPSISALTISKLVSNPLFLSHHGTVATEAALMGKPCLCTSASPFPKNARFVIQYSSQGEYLHYLKRWSVGRLAMRKKFRNDLMQWVAKRKLYLENKNHYFVYLYKKLGRKWRVNGPPEFLEKLEKYVARPAGYAKVRNLIYNKI